MATFLGFYLFEPVSSGLLAAIPLVTTLVVIGHAVRVERLDELGYAIVGLWGTLFALVALLGVWTELVPPRGVRPFDPVGIPGMFGAIAVLIGGYLFATRFVGRGAGRSG